MLGGAELPTVGVGPEIRSLRIRPTNPTSHFQSSPRDLADFVLPADFSYEIDLWGRIRRSVVAVGEEAQCYPAADLESVKLSLHAELAIDYFELRSADSSAAPARGYRECILRLTALARKSPRRRCVS